MSECDSDTRGTKKFSALACTYTSIAGLLAEKWTSRVGEEVEAAKEKLELKGGRKRRGRLDSRKGEEREETAKTHHYDHR